MNDFPQPQTNHMAGMADFQFIEVEGIAAIPVALNQTITEPITPKAGYSLATGYSSIDELEYDEKSKQSEDGQYFDARLKGFAPDSPAMIQTFSKMDGRRFVVLVIDNDGLKRLAGSIEQPLTFTADFETQTVSGQKGHSYEFTGAIIKRAPIYALTNHSSSFSSSGSIVS